jgi:hypothetical protein
MLEAARQSLLDVSNCDFETARVIGLDMMRDRVRNSSTTRLALVRTSSAL